MPIRATSAPNIALIKYWGNRNEELRLPAADSLSMTLDQPIVEVVVNHSQEFTARSFDANNNEDLLKERELARLRQHFVLAKKYLKYIGETDVFPAEVSLEIRSKIPRGVGLASSAAIFSALAEAYAGFAPKISRRNVSILARLGSGSASRSTCGGFAAMIAGEGDEADASYAEQIAPEGHWKLWDVIIVPSTVEKITGSTEGHALAHTSPLFSQRLRAIKARQKMCVEAIQQKDFEKLRVVAEEDCMNMHAVMASSTPALKYLSDDTYRIIREVEELRSSEGLAVLYTMDAGPSVHLICDESALPSVRAYAGTQKKCTVFEAGIGQGSRIT